MCVCGRGGGGRIIITQASIPYSHGALRLLPLCFATEAGEISASGTPESANVSRTQKYVLWLIDRG